MRVQGLLALYLIFLLAASGSGPVIGIAVGNGTFQVNHAAVTGNTTLFDGATIETAEASSRVRLKDGTRMELAANSRAVVFAGRMLLERGTGQLQGSSRYEVEARGLRITSGGGPALVRVQLDPGNTVRVAAVNGPARVFKAAGPLIAKVDPGASLRFDPQAQQEGAFQLSGCLLRKEGRFILLDQTTNVIVEVRGADTELSALVGNRVEIKATAMPSVQPVTGASGVVQVSSLQEIGPGGCLAAAQAAGAEPPAQATAPAAAKASHSRAIIAGVAVAGGAAVAAGVALGTRNSKSP